MEGGPDQVAATQDKGAVGRRCEGSESKGREGGMMHFYTNCQWMADNIQWHERIRTAGGPGQAAATQDNRVVERCCGDWENTGDADKSTMCTHCLRRPAKKEMYHMRTFFDNAMCIVTPNYYK